MVAGSRTSPTSPASRRSGSARFRTSFAAGRPRLLFAGDYRAPNNGRQTYDVSLNGQRFLLIKPAGDGAPTEIHIVLDFFEELKRLVPES